jgi:hypothetical protein
VPSTVPVKRAHRRFCEALTEECKGRPETWSVAIDNIAKRLGITLEEAIVLADDCHQAGLVRHDLPEHMRGRRLARRRGLEAAAAEESGEGFGQPVALNTATCTQATMLLERKATCPAGHIAFPSLGI